jgi:hypothetical protein
MHSKLKEEGGRRKPSADAKSQSKSQQHIKTAHQNSLHFLHFWKKI